MKVSNLFLYTFYSDEILLLYFKFILFNDWNFFYKINLKIKNINLEFKWKNLKQQKFNVRINWIYCVKEKKLSTKSTQYEVFDYQGEKVRQLKASTKDKAKWQPEVDKLLALKKQLTEAQQNASDVTGNDVQALEKAITEQVI